MGSQPWDSVVLASSEERMMIEQEERTALTVIEESITDHIPSYRDVLSRTRLPIFYGRDSLSPTTEKKVKGTSGSSDSLIYEGRVIDIKKGAVWGGLEKDFSPLKTKSARRSGVEKENGDSHISLLNAGRRALRAQKALGNLKYQRGGGLCEVRSPKEVP